MSNMDKYKHIPTKEIEQDIVDIEEEIIESERKVKGLRLVGDRMSMFRADGLQNGIKERKEFVADLRYILSFRDDRTIQLETGICETCGGTGEISSMEEVEPGNPATRADVGSEPCPDCHSEDNDEFEEDWSRG